MISHSSKFDIELERLQWAQDNKHICIIPYIERQVRSDEINPCCLYGLHNGPETRFIDFDNFNSRIKTIKNNIESGQIDKNCYSCHHAESNNQISDRVRQLLQHTSQEINEFLATKQTKEFTDIITFSNECNMACRMCNSGTSSLYGLIWENKKNTVKHLSDHSEYWKFLQEDIKNKIHNMQEVYRITIMGGEGTIQKDLFRLTDWLIKENLSQKVHLQISTNGSVFHDEIFDHWCKNFRHLSFAISVDSTNADNFPYVRYPVKFEKISKNLQSFKKFNTCPQEFVFFITPTFYINNIAYLKDFLDYFEEFDSDTKCLEIRDNTLSSPEYLKLSNLPNYIKKQLVDQITEYINCYSILERNHMFKTSIDNMLDQLRISEFSIASWRKYLYTSAKWDRLTGTDIAFHNKKLWDLFNDEDKSLYQQYRSKQNDLVH